MQKLNSISIALFFAISSFSTTLAQEVQPYILLNSKGKKVSWHKMNQRLQSAEAVFFGEEHNCVMSHWLTTQLLQEWTSTDSLNKSFALEMFERDQQLSLDSLQKGLFALEELPNHTKTWSNYKTDYAPILAVAMQKKLPIIASNIPRRYASKLFKEGRQSLEVLSDAEKKWICDLNFPFDKELSQYAKLKDMQESMAGKNFIEAQAIKDATMAESIVKELQAGRKVFHLNGSYHSDFQQSIIWYLKNSRPQTKTLTFSIIRQNSPKLSSEMMGKADFIFIIPENFPVSYTD